MADRPRESPPPGVHLPAGTRYLAPLRAMFAKQQEDCLAELNRKQGKAITKDHDRSIRLPGDFYDFDQWDAELAGDVRPVTEFYWQKGGQAATARFGLTAAGFSVRPPGTQAAIVQAAFALSRSVNRTTHRRMAQVVEGLKTEISDGLWHGDTHAELVKRVNGVFAEASDYRSHMIAGTEAARAVHMGALDAAKQSRGLVIGKRFLLSGNPCPLCVAVAEKNLGKVVPLDAEFARIGDHPDYQSIVVPPVHVNCLCSWEEVLMPEPKGRGD